MEEFNIHNKPLIKNDLVEIVDNYSVLHYDEFPILYIGTNKFGNKIIGSLLEEDDDNKKMYALHTILTNKQYSQFLNNKISYLNILQNSNSICLVEKDFNFKTLQAFDFDINSIPIDYLPLENSYCPATVKAHSLVFSISLKGKLADINKAIADEVSQIQIGFSEFLEDRVNLLKGLNLKPKALLQPYVDGSFKINFELDVINKTKKPNLFTTDIPIDNYISTYIKYISENFVDDKELFINDNLNVSPSFKELENSFAALYDVSFIKIPDDLTTLIKEDILKSVAKFEKICEQVGENFDSAEIANINQNVEQSLAFLDKEFSDNLQNKIEEIEISKKGITIDENFQQYKIYIYHLNTDTRTGNALIKNIGNEEVMSKPKIKINGEEGLEQTKYTESLYLNKWITVNAKAKKVGEKFNHLSIDFEAT